MRRDRVLLLGPAPSPSGDPSHPLTGGRGTGRMLQHLTGTTLAQYVRLYERRNLIRLYPGERFPAPEARAAALALLSPLAGRRVVLLGADVARAFGFDTESPKFVWIERDGVRFALSPHPSGRNLWWNDYGNRAEAARFFGSITTGE